jgi:hypothetical protein
MVRIYDKAVESRGAIPSVRFETQWRDDYATKLFYEIMACEGWASAQKMAVRYSLGSVDFIDRIDEVLSRCPRLEWWAEFLRFAGDTSRLSAPRVQPMVSDKKRWIENQVVGTIALICKCMGHAETWEWLSKEVQHKKEHLSSAAQAYYRSWLDRIAVESMEFESAVAYHQYTSSIDSFLSWEGT